MTFGTVGCWPAGPIRPSGPWCLGPARGSLDPSRAARQSGLREGLKLVSTVFRRWRLARWAAGGRARSVLQGHGVWALRGGPLTRAGPLDRAGLGKVWSWFLRCSEGDVWHGGLLAGGFQIATRQCPPSKLLSIILGSAAGGVALLYYIILYIYIYILYTTLYIYIYIIYYIIYIYIYTHIFKNGSITKHHPFCGSIGTQWNARCIFGRVLDDDLVQIATPFVHEHSWPAVPWCHGAMVDASRRIFRPIIIRSGYSDLMGLYGDLMGY